MPLVRWAINGKNISEEEFDRIRRETKKAVANTQKTPPPPRFAQPEMRAPSMRVSPR